MLKLRHVLRYFTEGNSEKNKQRGSNSIKIIIFKQPNSSLHSLKKQSLRGGQFTELESGQHVRFIQIFIVY